MKKGQDGAEPFTLHYFWCEDSLQRRICRPVIYSLGLHDYPHVDSSKKTCHLLHSHIFPKTELGVWFQMHTSLSLLWSHLLCIEIGLLFHSFSANPYWWRAGKNQWACTVPRQVAWMRLVDLALGEVRRPGESESDFCTKCAYAWHLLHRLNLK